MQMQVTHIESLMPVILYLVSFDLVFWRHYLIRVADSSELGVQANSVGGII